jgi:hypothetical protein
MLAILGALAAVIAGLLLFLGGHQHVAIWLLTIGLFLVCIEVAYVVYRGGWYRRVPPA